MNAVPMSASLREVDTLPRPRGALPIIGHMLQLSPPTRHHLVLERWAAELGTPYVFRLGRTPITVWADTELAHTVMRERPHRYRRFERIESILDEVGSNGLFSVEGRAWESQRRLVMQALSINHIKAFYPTLAGITERLRSRWASAARAGRVVNMIDELRLFTVDVTSALVFGEDPNTLEKERDLIQEHVSLLMPMLMFRLNAPFAYWHYVRFPRDRRFDHAIAEVHRYVRGLMARARERLRAEAARVGKSAAQDGEAEPPRNLIEAMLIQRDAPGSGITDDEVAANILTMLVAGEDTTAMAIAWGLLYLGSDQALQTRVAAHARGVLGDASVCPSYAAMRELDLCEAVCTEASRLHAVAPYLSFEPLEEVRLNGVRLPAGTKMFFLNRPGMIDARHFADPSRYDPDRWLHDNRETKGTHDGRAYMQFGAGPRVCPGRHLAVVEMRLVMSMLAANFESTLMIDPADVHEVCTFATGPNAIPMRLKLRDVGRVTH
ncbi:Cytochrome P450 [Candidatus Burkholderia verschuerenii]|uniref:Cytochrome P450 n=1 Tax=Candidatus Burkholderia verschuerenii TaxID=242163 RepID=A0A0L0MJ30_9BURK|nr:cytochrome P450 [Candidatus Burkholderia verschuerenii]KND61999.1 Cytochrome P450 [Candidatus Burkholderia verschuerenii]